jgi:Putative transposase/Transposase zinc-binding domain
MIEVADILRRYGPAYRAEHSLLPSQQKALEDLVRCRTAACGGHLFACDHCGQPHYSYHSCRNRHCPKCHGQQTDRWLEQQQQRLLPCAYYLLTFTLPQGLRALAWSHQKALYALLLRSAARALQKLAWDPKYVGGQLATLAVLHTWTRALLYHPHAHLLVSAGGLSAEGQRWVHPKNPAFLVPCFALSKIFKGKFRDGLKRLGWLDQVQPAVWQQNWVVHCQHAGSGQKVLDYLGRYVFRIAISNSRLEALANGHVTFRYRDNRTQQIQHLSLSANEFIARFLRHVLPKGLVKVRAYGLGNARNADQLQKARTLLAIPTSLPQTPELTLQSNASDGPLSLAHSDPLLCPQCKTGHLIWVRELLPQRTRGP